MVENPTDPLHDLATLLLLRVIEKELHDLTGLWIKPVEKLVGFISESLREVVAMRDVEEIVEAVAMTPGLDMAIEIGDVSTANGDSYSKDKASEVAVVLEEKIFARRLEEGLEFWRDSCDFKHKAGDLV